MSAIDTAKEIVRLGATAGLSKDVIDLMEKKLALLTDENRVLKDLVTRLEAENQELRRQAPPASFVTSEGLLWKRTANGFEKRPYCPSCRDKPVMMAFPPGSDENWVCPANHIFDGTIKPPSLTTG